MASNDTLFNFEDTLGDRDDMLSPRNAVHSGSNTANSATPQPETCKTPTNEALLTAYPVEYKPNDLNAYTDSHLVSEIRPNSLHLNFENLTNNLGDLLSPEQQKTFSEEINTIEQLSSDLSATIDATNTLDDLKTCISVHLNDDVNSDNSESEAISIEPRQTHSPIVNGTFECADSPIHTPTNETMNIIESPITDTTTHTNVDGNISNKKSNETPKADTTLDIFEPIDSAKENTSPNLDFLRNVTKSSNLNKTIEMNDIGAKIESQPPNEQNHLDELSTCQLSGEEDPWV